MNESFGGLMNGGFTTAVAWTIAALVLLVILLVIVRIIRNRGSGTFVLGGRHRAPRLAVIDAAAVDDRRRLVLVRRDEIEHLILIGGPTDIVVEQNIRPYTAVPAAPQPRREPQVMQAPTPPPAAPVPPRPAESAPQRVQPAPVRTAAPPRPESLPPRSERAAAPEQPQRREAPIAPPPSVVEPRPRPAAEPAAPRQDQLRTPPPTPTGGWREEAAPEIARESELDTAFLEEIRPAAEAPRVAPAQEPAPRRQETSIEEEMSRLLDDLSEDEKNQR